MTTETITEQKMSNNCNGAATLITQERVIPFNGIVWDVSVSNSNSERHIKVTVQFDNGANSVVPLAAGQHQYVHTTDNKFNLGCSIVGCEFGIMGESTESLEEEL